ncbi:MAG: aldolase [Clostridia bacterium]|nr:aldolase [Clostridia bacterium]
MSLKLMYITNNKDIAFIAQKYGVDRIWIDLETLGKEERQKNLDSVKSRHNIEDVAALASFLDKSELMVRVNPWNPMSQTEIDKVVDSGARIVMLPMWKSVGEVEKFLNAVKGRAKTSLLLETKEAVECVDDVLSLKGIDEVHIGLNDLHLSYGLKFMFELLSNGTVEMLCKKLHAAAIPYGFGGIAGIGKGLLPAENIIPEHYRLGSSRVILSRSFYSFDGDINKADETFEKNISQIKQCEQKSAQMDADALASNQRFVESKIKEIVGMLTESKING